MLAYVIALGTTRRGPPPAPPDTATAGSADRSTAPRRGERRGPQAEAWPPRHPSRAARGHADASEIDHLASRRGRSFAHRPVEQPEPMAFKLFEFVR
jgi:hypothetical protein